MPSAKANKLIEKRQLLLIKKYSDSANFSQEDESQLEALSQELVRLYPRVTQKDFDELAKVQSRLDSSAKFIEALCNKYGI